MSTVLERLNAELSSGLELAKRSLVEIRNGHGLGAGTIWHKSGLVITNAHVLRQRGVRVALYDGTVLPAQVLSYDKELDLAALGVSAEGLTPIQVADSRLLKPGEWVMALGHPWGVAGAVTSGVVIGQGGELPEMQGGREWIAVGLKMRPGHSGGPLIDTLGRLVGVNTMITGPGVGMAVPAHIVREFLQHSGVAERYPTGKAEQFV